LDDRLARDVEDLAIRVRAIEALDTPSTRALVGQVADLQRRVDRINDEGATATRGELRRLSDRITRTEADVVNTERDLATKADAQALAELKEDQKWMRRAVVVAMLTAVAAFVGNWILQAVSG
jgi:hypothetical protein